MACVCPQTRVKTLENSRDVGAFEAAQKTLRQTELELMQKQAELHPVTLLTSVLPHACGTPDRYGTGDIEKRLVDQTVAARGEKKCTHAQTNQVKE